MTEGADKCLAHRISRNTGHDQWRSVAQMLHFFFVFVAFENMTGTVLEKYVGSPLLMVKLNVCDADIFSSHCGDTSQSEIGQMERCLIS